MERKNVLICTQHRGVFFGSIAADTDLAQKTLIDVKDARMAIYWGTDKGVMQLAETGPTSSSRISATADIAVLHDVTGIFSVTDEATAKWKSA